MSHLAGLLRQITTKSQNPNALIYQLQLERAKQKYLVDERLGGGSEAAVALEAPESERLEKELEQEKAALDTTKQSGSEAVERRNEGVESNKEVEMERRGADRDDAGTDKGKGYV
jgi:hypothetical protein